MLYGTFHIFRSQSAVDGASGGGRIKGSKNTMMDEAMFRSVKGVELVESCSEERALLGCVKPAL